MRVWLPFPQEYRQQKDIKLISTSPKYAVLAESSQGDPPTQGAAQRTLYFEARVADPPKSLSFEEVFEFTTSAYYPKLDDAQAKPLPADYAEGDLGERPPHIRFTPEVKATVARIVGDETNPLAKARRIFRYVSENVAYCSEEEYSTIASLSTKALRSRKGDCGIHAMTFITLCRAAGIPARWQSGWETLPPATTCTTGPSSTSPLGVGCRAIRPARPTVRKKATTRRFATSTSATSTRIA